MDVPIGLSAAITVMRRATINGIRRLRHRKPVPDLRVNLTHLFKDICRRAVAFFGLENRPPACAADPKDIGVHRQAVTEQRAEKGDHPTRGRAMPSHATYAATATVHIQVHSK